MTKRFRGIKYNILNKGDGNFRILISASEMHRDHFYLLDDDLIKEEIKKLAQIKGDEINWEDYKVNLEITFDKDSRKKRGFILKSSKITSDLVKLN